MSLWARVASVLAVMAIVAVVFFLGRAGRGEPDADTAAALPPDPGYAARDDGELTEVVVQFPVDGWGSTGDLDLREAISFELSEALGWTGNGHVDGVRLIPVAPPGERAASGQPTGPPLLVSGRKEPAMRRAARLGDGWMPYLYSASAYARSVHTIEDEARAVGRGLDGFEWMLYLYCSVRRDRDRAREDVAEFLGGAYGDKPGGMLERIAPAGTPEEVAARVQEYVDAGARHVVISPAAREDTLEVVTLAAEEVLPRLASPAPVDG